MDNERNGAWLYFTKGERVFYTKASDALLVYFTLPRHIRVAFRHETDATPVYAWDYVRG